MLHVSGRVSACGSSAAAVPVWHEDVRYYDVHRRGSGGGHRRHLLRPLSARRQVHACRRVAGRGASRARGRTPDHRAGRELRPPGPHARRGGDAFPRVRPHAARRPLGDALQPARGHERASATSWRRRPRCTRSGRAGSRAWPRCGMSAGNAPLMDSAPVDRLNAARRFGARHRSTRASTSTRRSTWRCTARQPRPALETWKRDGGGARRSATFQGTSSPARLRTSPAVRGRLLRLHVGGGHRARHAVGLRRRRLMNPQVGRASGRRSCAAAAKSRRACWSSVSSGGRCARRVLRRDHRAAMSEGSLSGAGAGRLRPPSTRGTRGPGDPPARWGSCSPSAFASSAVVSNTKMPAS